MSKLIESIINKDYTSASKSINEQIASIVERKMYEMKKMVSARDLSDSLKEAMMKLDSNNRVPDTDTLQSVDKAKRSLAEKKGDYEPNPEQEALVKGDPLIKKAFTSMNVAVGKPARRIQKRTLDAAREAEMAKAGHKGRTPQDYEKAQKKLKRYDQILGKLAQSKDPDFASVGERQQKFVQQYIKK